MIRHLNDLARLPERTVVIGASGFVGAALAKRLRDCGAQLLALGRPDVDLLAPDATARLCALLRPADAVVAVAAKAPCRNAALLAENAVIIRNLVEALKSVRVAHVVNISSDAVYADEPVPLRETSPVAPTSLHGAMHLAREIAFASEVPSPLAIMRPSLLYGAADPHDGYGPNRFRRLANLGKDITLFGEGEERRDHVLIDDVAEVIIQVLARRSVGVLNIATGETHSFRKVAEIAVATAGREVAIKGSPRAGPMPHNGYRPFDIANLHKAFPEFAFTRLEEGMRKAQHDAMGAR
jgi:nucleoside-diphosphate-sugar epimerase